MFFHDFAFIVFQVKQIRIPRPKYSSSSSSGKIHPREEPPRDYDLDMKNCRQETQKFDASVELQRAFQEKL
jgi:hypothetical protein